MQVEDVPGMARAQIMEILRNRNEHLEDDVQIELAELDDAGVQHALARNRWLVPAAQAILVRSPYATTIDALSRCHALSSSAQERIVERCLLDDDDPMKVFLDLDTLPADGQRHAVTHPRMGEEDRWRLFLASSHGSVRMAYLRTLGDDDLADVLSVYRISASADLWDLVHEKLIAHQGLAAIVRRYSLVRASEALRRDLGSIDDLDLQRALVGNPGWSLALSAPVAALRGDERGESFLEANRPGDPSTFDALVGSWTGTLAELLVVCDELGQD